MKSIFNKNHALGSSREYASCQGCAGSRWKILFILSVLLPLTACSSINYIKSDRYILSNDNYAAQESYFSSVEAVSVDADKQLVTFKKNQLMLQLTAKRMSREDWLTDCYTNTSYEILETWQLDSSLFLHPYYIVASCFDRNEIFITDSPGNDGLAVGLLFEGNN